MIKILTRLLIFLCILILADRVIAYVFSHRVFAKIQSGERGGTVNYILKKKNIDYLVLGSSRAKHQLDPALLASIAGQGFNAGVNGTGGIVYNHLLLSLLIDKGIIPKTIVLQTDAFPYFTEDDKQINIELSPLYLFIGESKALKKELGKFTDYAEKTKLLFHSYRFNGKPLNILYNYVQRNSIPESNGFAGLPGILDTVHYKPTTRAAMEHKYSQKKLQTLSAIVNTCRNYNIQLIVILPPSYKNCLFTEAGNEIVKKQLAMQPGVSAILDFSDVNKIPVLRNAENWRDASHLNANGAMIFSSLVNQSLQSYPK